GTLDGDKIRAIHLRAEQLSFLEVLGHEDVSVHSRACGMGGYCIGQVAGRCAGQGRITKLPGLRRSDGYHPVLERPAWVGAIVLDVEVPQSQFLGQVLGLNQRRESRLQVDRLAIAGQQVPIAPDRRRSVLDALAADSFAHRLVVVSDFEGAETEFADVDWTNWILAGALAAAEGSC